MSQFELELKNFKVAVEALREEMDEVYGELDGPEAEDFLHRVIAYITDFSYLVEGAAEQHLQYINREWPVQFFMDLCRFYTEMIGKIDPEFRQIFKIEYNEILARIKFYVKLPEGGLRKREKQAQKANAENQAPQSSSFPYEELIAAKGELLKMKLVEHFSPWISTPYCRQMLNMILDSVSKCSYADGRLRLDHKTPRGDKKVVLFGEAYGGEFDAGDNLPDSYKTVVELHNEIIFGGGLPEGLHFLGYDHGPRSEFNAKSVKADPKVYVGICDIGFDWIVWKRDELNALQEPLMMLIRHNQPLSTAVEFPGQKLVAYGFGGLMIRCMGFYLFPDTIMFKGFHWESNKSE